MTRYEVVVMGETIDDTDALFSFLILADSEEQAVAKAESILKSVFFGSCVVMEGVAL